MKIGISPSNLLEFVIKPVLNSLDMDSDAARLLLLCTAAQESRMGHYLKQIKGPACGIWQIEPSTHSDVYKNYLNYRPSLLDKVSSFSRFEFHSMRERELITNLEYACVIARLIYYRIPHPLPNVEDIRGLGAYWDDFYNANPEKGTVDEFMANYHKYIEGKM